MVNHFLEPVPLVVLFWKRFNGQIIIDSKDFFRKKGRPDNR